MSIKTTKNSGEKHAYVQGVGCVTIEVDRRKKVASAQYYRMGQEYKTKIKQNVTSIYNEDQVWQHSRTFLYFLPNE